MMDKQMSLLGHAASYWTLIGWSQAALSQFLIRALEQG